LFFRNAICKCLNTILGLQCNVVYSDNKCSLVFETMQKECPEYEWWQTWANIRCLAVTDWWIENYPPYQSQARSTFCSASERKRCASRTPQLLTPI